VEVVVPGVVVAVVAELVELLAVVVVLDETVVVLAKLVKVTVVVLVGPGAALSADDASVLAGVGASVEAAADVELGASLALLLVLTGPAVLFAAVVAILACSVELVKGTNPPMKAARLDESTPKSFSLAHVRLELPLKPEICTVGPFGSFLRNTLVRFSLPMGLFLARSCRATAISTPPRSLVVAAAPPWTWPMLACP